MTDNEQEPKNDVFDKLYVKLSSTKHMNIRLQINMWRQLEWLEPAQAMWGSEPVPFKSLQKTIFF